MYMLAFSQWEIHTFFSFDYLIYDNSPNEVTTIESPQEMAKLQGMTRQEQGANVVAEDHMYYGSNLIK